jgi:hypothetical protein
MAKKKKEMDNLAKDAAAALAVGMSYGKWKAIHGNTKEDNQLIEEETIPEGWGICQHCGKPFKPRSRRPQKYCDSVCQQTELRERYIEKHRERNREYQRKKREEQKGE